MLFANLIGRDDRPWRLIRAILYLSSLRFDNTAGPSGSDRIQLMHYDLRRSSHQAASLCLLHGSFPIDFSELCTQSAWARRPCDARGPRTIPGAQSPSFHALPVTTVDK